MQNNHVSEEGLCLQPTWQLTPSGNWAPLGEPKPETSTDSSRRWFCGARSGSCPHTHVGRKGSGPFTKDK